MKTFLVLITIFSGEFSFTQWRYIETVSQDDCIKTAKQEALDLYLTGHFDDVGYGCVFSGEVSL